MTDTVDGSEIPRPTTWDVLLTPEKYWGKLPTSTGAGFLLSTVPIPSMYGIFTYIWLIFMVNVGKYTGYDFPIVLFLGFFGAARNDVETSSPELAPWQSFTGTGKCRLVGPKN